MSIRRLAPDKKEGPPALLAGETSETHAVRFVLADRTVSFPQTAFDYWERAGEPPRESLRIMISGHAVVITGQHLAVLHDALDAGTVRLVRPGSGGSPAAGPLRITTIELVLSPTKSPQPS